MTWQHGKSMKEYYDARAPEYHEWYLDEGQYAARERPGWNEAVRALERAVAGLPPARTLDVACGTGFLTRHQQGEVTGLDQSERMLEIASEREERQTRTLNDGSSYRVYKRYFDADALAAELGGGRVLHAGDWFVKVTTSDETAPSR